jgi:hypothetical protein
VKHPSLGPFPMVRDIEAHERARYQQHASGLEIEIAKTEAVAMLATDPRFKLWIAEIEKQLSSAEEELLGAFSAHALAVAQGKVLALRSIVAITRLSEKDRLLLAQRLREAHDEAVAQGLHGTGPIQPGRAIWSDDHGRGNEQRQQGRSNPGDGH